MACAQGRSSQVAEHIAQLHHMTNDHHRRWLGIYEANRSLAQRAHSCALLIGPARLDYS